MEKLYIGLNISRDWITYTIYNDQTRKCFEDGQLRNGKPQLAKFIKQTIRRFKEKQLFWCFEQYGIYGLLFILVLEQFNQIYYVIPAVEINDTKDLKGIKDDRIEAGHVALYVSSYQHKLVPSELQMEELSPIKQLVSYKKQLVKIQTQLKNSLKIYNVLNEQTARCIIIDIEKKLKELQADIGQLGIRINEEIQLQLEENPDIFAH